MKLDVHQYIDDKWVFLISLPLSDEIRKEELEHAIDNLSSRIFDNDKTLLYSGNGAVIFKRTDGPISISVVK